jgi:hypothetical protein
MCFVCMAIDEGERDLAVPASIPLVSKRWSLLTSVRFAHRPLTDLSITDPSTLSTSVSEGIFPFSPSLLRRQHLIREGESSWKVCIVGQASFISDWSSDSRRLPGTCN